MLVSGAGKALDEEPLIARDVHGLDHPSARPSLQPLTAAHGALLRSGLMLELHGCCHPVGADFTGRPVPAWQGCIPRMVPGLVSTVSLDRSRLARWAPQTHSRGLATSLPTPFGTAWNKRLATLRLQQEAAQRDAESPQSPPDKEKRVRRRSI